MAGRDIDRSQYADAVEEKTKRCQENQQLYRTRQEINSFFKFSSENIFLCHQAAMGLQTLQLNGTRESKWRTQFDYAGL